MRQRRTTAGCASDWRMRKVAALPRYADRPENKTKERNTEMEVVKMGDFTLEKILGPAEYGDKLGLYARVVVPPKAAVPYHQHVGDSESYYILSGNSIGAGSQSVSLCD